MERLIRLVAASMALVASAVALAAGASGSDEATGPRPTPAVRVAHAVKAEVLNVALAGTRLVAVGDHGVVLLSDDAGTTWRQAKSVPVDSTLTSVSFVDAKRGWAVGHVGVVLVTTDGGESWAVQRRVASEDRPLFAIRMFDADNGVAVGLWSLVLVTADGGKTWDTVVPPKPEGVKKADLNLFALFVNDKGELFAAAERGSLLRSADRGRNWSYISTGYKGSFWTGAALPGGALLAAGLRGSVYRSGDDGKTWTRIETGTKASVTTLLVKGQDVLGLGLDGLVLRSSDGGASFKTTVREDHASLTAGLLLADGGEVMLSRQGVLTAAAKN
jgi:photosystem II stability/assembly factor-like uncharacterized protein